jgi:hypothetical protein
MIRLAEMPSAEAKPLGLSCLATVRQALPHWRAASRHGQSTSSAKKSPVLKQRGNPKLKLNSFAGPGLAIWIEVPAHFCGIMRNPSGKSVQKGAHVLSPIRGSSSLRSRTNRLHPPDEAR